MSRLQFFVPLSSQQTSSKRRSRHFHFSSPAASAVQTDGTRSNAPASGTRTNLFHLQQLSIQVPGLPATSASSRRIEKFPYFGLRLSILKQAFDETADEPKSIWHWWWDDRKKVQWYTFWIAAVVFILTVVFGIIQSVTAIVQTEMTVKAANSGGNGNGNAKNG